MTWTTLCLGPYRIFDCLIDKSTTLTLGLDTVFYLEYLSGV